MIQTNSSFASRDSSAVLVIPFFGKEVIATWKDFPFKGIWTPLELGDFTGKEGQISLVYEGNERIVLLGLGEKFKIESIRKAYASLSHFARKNKWHHLNLLLPKGVATQCAEGILFANYAFGYKKEKENLIEAITLIEATPEEQQAFTKVMQIGVGMNLTRDLVNANADDITPQYLASVAQNMAKEHANVTTTILDKKAIEAEKMGLLLAVNRGSNSDPALIVCEYRGDPSSKEKSAIVGKGITFDTGGLNLKPTGSMETMKCDMAGGAAALGLIKAAALCGLKVNIAAVVPATENGIDATSYKPGDVYRAMNGMTVEITNTDAEGRLVLADALTYSVRHLKATRIIDLATLTGAIEITFGDVRSGLFCNDEELERSLIAAGQRTGEKLWPLPLDPEYRDYMKSDIADIKNAKKRMAGSITAAIFLQEFVENVPWAHLDIAATAYLSEGKFFGTTPASGIGVRLLFDFLENLSGE